MYVLMHKDTPVLECYFPDGYFERCGAVLNKDLLPIGTSDRFGFSSRQFADWFGRRSIPRDRINYNTDMQLLHNPSTNQFMLNNYACNLSDQYWMKPAGSDVTWDEINFFKNDFSKSLGDLMLGNYRDVYHGNAIGPDSATNGNLIKAWRALSDGRRILLKKSTALHQEPYNEVIGSRFCRVVGIRSAVQGLVYDDSAVYSGCECMVDTNTELISAWDIQRQYGMTFGNDPKVLLEDYKNILSEHGIVSNGIDQMIVVDYLLRNTDRHWSNFGIIRDSNTLEWKETIPLYDFGNSLWHDDLAVSQIEGRSALTGMSLRDDLRLVRHCPFTVKDVDAFEDIVMDVLSDAKDVNREHVTEVIQAVSDRAETVKWNFDLQDAEREHGYAFTCE